MLSWNSAMGWIRTRRDSKGGFSFLELNDGSCLANLQIVADANLANYESDVKRLSHPALARERHAEDRRGHEAGLVEHGVRASERAQHDGEGHRVVEVLGDEASVQDLGEHHRGAEPDRRAGRGGAGDRPHRFTAAAVLVDEHLEHHDGEQRADGVDEDPLPAKHSADAGPQPGVPQERDDHRRAGDGHDRAEQDGGTERQPADAPRGEGPDDGGRHHAEREEAHEHHAHAPELAPAQAQTAFEEEDPDRRRHRGEQQVAVEGIGVEDAEERSDRQPRREQRDDRRHGEALGHDDADHPEADDDREPRHGVVDQHDAADSWLCTRLAPRGATVVAATVPRAPDSAFPSTPPSPA